MDILKRYVGEALAAGVIVAAIVYSITPTIANADIYNPHPVPPSNSVTTAMIKDGQITPAKLQETGSYYVKELNATSTTVGTSTVNNDAILPGKMTINGLTYTYPSTRGASNSVLTENGSGSLTWKTPSSDAIFTSLTSGTSTTLTTPKAVYMDGTAIPYISRQSRTTIAQQSKTSGSFGGSFTVNAGSDRAAFVSVTVSNINGISSITDSNGTLTLIGSAVYNNNFLVYVYEETAPAVGSHTITVTPTSYNGTAYILATAAVYDGVNQTTPYTSVQQTTTAQSVSVTPAHTYDWLACATSASANSGTSYCNLSNTTDYNPVSTLSYSSGDSGAEVGSVSPQTIGLTSTASGQAIVGYDIEGAGADYYGFKYTNAAASGTTNGFIGFINSSPTVGTAQNVYTSGYLSGFSGLSTGSVYYLDNTDGGISTTAGTVSYKVGVAVSSTSLMIQ